MRLQINIFLSGISRALLCALTLTTELRTIDRFILFFVMILIGLEILTVTNTEDFQHMLKILRGVTSVLLHLKKVTLCNLVIVLVIWIEGSGPEETLIIDGEHLDSFSGLPGSSKAAKRGC